MGRPKNSFILRNAHPPSQPAAQRRHASARHTAHARTCTPACAHQMASAGPCRQGRHPGSPTPTYSPSTMPTSSCCTISRPLHLSVAARGTQTSSWAGNDNTAPIDAIGSGERRRRSSWHGHFQVGMLPVSSLCCLASYSARDHHAGGAFCTRRASFGSCV